MLDTLSSLPGKFLNVLVEWICPDGIIPDSGLSGLNNIYIYIYIYIYSSPAYICSPWELSSLAKELTVATGVK